MNLSSSQVRWFLISQIPLLIMSQDLATMTNAPLINSRWYFRLLQASIIQLFKVTHHVLSYVSPQFAISSRHTYFHSFKMLSATLMFAQTHHCDITETILCCWEVANPSKAKGKIRPRWHVKDTLNTVIFMRKQYHLIIMRDQNLPPPMTNMLNLLTTSTLSS